MLNLKRESFYLLTFASSTNAMAAKKALEASIPSFFGRPVPHDCEILEPLTFRLIPIPPEIDASCGLCMKIENVVSESQSENQNGSQDKNQSEKQDKNHIENQNKIQDEGRYKRLFKVLGILNEKKIAVEEIYECKSAKEGLLCTILTMPQLQ